MEPSRRVSPTSPCRRAADAADGRDEWWAASTSAVVGQLYDLVELLIKGRSIKQSPVEHHGREVQGARAARRIALDQHQIGDLARLHGSVVARAVHNLGGTVRRRRRTCSGVGPAWASRLDVHAAAALVGFDGAGVLIPSAPARHARRES